MLKISSELNRPETINKFNQLIDSFVASDSVGEARQLAPILSGLLALPEFKKSEPDLFSIYNNYLLAVKYIILFDLGEEEIVQLIKNNFSFVLDHPDYDLPRKIRYKIRDINSLEARDAFKEKLRQALLNCSAYLGQEKIILNDLKLEPTIGNWLKDYYTKVGMDQVDKLKLSEYLVGSPNIKLLSSENKAKFKELLNFFEDLKVSSREFPMFEESMAAILPNNDVAILINGQPENLNGELTKITEEALAAGAPLVPRTAELEQILKKYPPDSLEYKAVKQEIEHLRKPAAKPLKLDVKK